jgi:hypothetical protein
MPLYAQDEGEGEEEGVAYGSRVTGTLNDRNPRAVYTFDGARCEVIAIRLTATDGDLDPVLTVMDTAGTVIASRDDTNGTRDAIEEAVRIPRSDRYYVVVGRFGYRLGSTAGDYELTIERIGVGPASGCVLRYGDSVPNTITHSEQEFYYVFRAERGDILNIQMRRMSGNLDPYIQVVNSAQVVIADNDDAPGGQNARIQNLLIEESGTYVIIASRYGQARGTSTGGFALTVEEAEFSGLANSAQAALNITPGETIEDALTDQQPVKYYAFEAKRDDIVTIRMNQDGGRLDSFVKLLNAGLQELATDDDGGDGKNAQISRFMIPADGTYYIIATRYEGTDAIPTIGRFTLELEFSGNAFDGVPLEVPRLSYGSTVTGYIDDALTEVLYAFWGVEGDVVTVAMNRGDGDLDPVVSILNEDQRALVSDDDGGGEQNARIERYEIRRTGVYYIRATRYAGTESQTNTKGSFIVVLARRFD